MARAETRVPDQLADEHTDRLTDEDYERLLEFRTGIRRFLNWSEQQAEAAGLTPAQHQLALAIRGHAGPDAPTVGEVAQSLLLRHNSAVGLVDRAEQAGIVRRHVDRHDARVVRLTLTALGARRLDQLTALHLEELRRLGPRLRVLWKDLEAPPSV